MTVKIVKNDVDKLTGEVEAFTRLAVPKIGHDAEAIMKNEVHVVTGNLKNNTGFKMTGETSGELFSSAPYAGPHNYGTAHTPANPYFTHGVEHARRDLDDAQQHVKKMLS